MIKELERLGLTYYESKVLYILLKETLTAKEISKKQNIPPGKIYSIIKSLEKKDLIQSINTRPQKFYVDNPSRTLDILIEKKQNDHDILLSSIKEYATRMDMLKSKNPKFFQIGITDNERKDVQTRVFIESKKEVCQIFNNNHKPKSNRITKSIWENEIEKAAERGVTFRCIYPKNIILPKTLSNLTKNKPESFKVKRLDTTFTRCDIVDSKKVLVKITGEDEISHGGSIFIENEKMAKNLQNIFEELWKEAD